MPATRRDREPFASGYLFLLDRLERSTNGAERHVALHGVTLEDVWVDSTSRQAGSHQQRGRVRVSAHKLAV